MATITATIKYRIRDARKSAGLTQTELAEKVGVRQHSISNFEKGVYDPSSETFARICVALGCQPGEIVTLEIAGDGPKKT